MRTHAKDQYQRRHLSRIIIQLCLNVIMALRLRKHSIASEININVRNVCIEIETVDVLFMQ